MNNGLEMQYFYREQKRHMVNHERNSGRPDDLSEYLLQGAEAGPTIPYQRGKKMRSECSQ